MSTYLNIYLVSKHKEGDNIPPEPLLLSSYSRNSPIFQALSTYIFDTKDYTTLTANKVNLAIYDVKQNIENTKETFANKVEALQKLRIDKEMADSFLDEYSNIKTFIEESKVTLVELQMLYDIIKDLEWGDFEKVCVNIE